MLPSTIVLSEAAGDTLLTRGSCTQAGGPNSLIVSHGHGKGRLLLLLLLLLLHYVLGLVGMSRDSVFPHLVSI